MNIILTDEQVMELEEKTTGRQWSDFECFIPLIEDWRSLMFEVAKQIVDIEDWRSCHASEQKRAERAEAAAAQATADVARLTAERDDYGRKYSALMQVSGGIAADRDALAEQLKAERADLDTYRKEIERLTRKVWTS